MRQIFSREFWALFWRHLTENFLNTLLQVVGILLVYLILRYIINRVIDSVLTRLMEREQHLGLSEERIGRLRTLQGLCRSVISYVLFFVFGVMFLKAVGFDILPFVTTASVIGLAVGFGSQKLVKDVISGFFIIIDDMFVVGDIVTIGTVTGRVIEMGMRVTRLLDFTGKVYVLSNGDIGTITNLSRNPVEDFIEIALAASADLNRAVEVINAAGAELFAQEGHHLKAAPHVQGITAFSAASVTVRVTVVSAPGDLLAAQMQTRAAIREALVKAALPLA